MTNIEFKAALRDLGMMQRELAKLIGCQPNTVSRWARGEVAVPQYVEVIIDQRRRDARGT